MTLDDIRARDAADIPIALDMTGADWRRALWQVAADRRTLLGMLEPSAIPEHEPCCACCSEVDRHVLSDPDVVAAMGMDRLAAAEAVCEAAVVIRDGSHLIHDTDYNTDPLWQALYVWQEARR